MQILILIFYKKLGFGRPPPPQNPIFSQKFTCEGSPKIEMIWIRQSV